MEATTTTVRGLRVAELAAAVGVVPTPSASTRRPVCCWRRLDSGGLPAYEASAVDGCQSGAAHVDDFAIQVRVARACLTGQGEILYWQSRSRHLSYGAGQKLRIAAIERPDVREVDRDHDRLTDWPWRATCSAARFVGHGRMEMSR